MDGAVEAWVDGELGGCSLADDRLIKRLRKLLAQIGSAMGQSIRLVCQDWANAKAAYRFFANDRVSEADILAGHFQATREGWWRPMDRSSCCTTPRSSAIKERIPKRSA